MPFKRLLPCLIGATVLATFVSGGAVLADPFAASGRARMTEQYRHVPMPPGFKVLFNELEGPVYADAAGKTLYTWPFKAQRAGETGDQIGKPACTFQKRTESGGILEPYPGGFVLPDLDRRPSCAEQWPPVFASDDAKPVGSWSIVERPEGRKQWAYDGYPLYTSIRDKKPGDVLGGTRKDIDRYEGEGRLPMGPPLLAPPTFSVVPTINGRLLATGKGVSVYTSDNDRPKKSNCTGQCLQVWKPVIAPLFAEVQGEWSVFERSPGVKQWAFRNRPLYTFIEDGETTTGSVTGSDIPGWHNVYTQQVARPPSDFTLQDTSAGQALADSRGHTVYVYNCLEDVVDQFACNRPDSPQQYRLAVCGGGDIDRCLRLFPYVPFSRKAKNDSSLWGPMNIDVRTGHEAAPGAKDAMQVWAYRGMPVFTYSGDRQPGSIKGSGWGEGGGGRNGFTVFLVRDDFSANAQ